MSQTLALIQLTGRGIGLTAKALLITAAVLWIWFSGRAWRADYRGRRYLTRPVRAAAQTLATALVIAALWQPIPTLTTLALVIAAVCVTAHFTRRAARMRRSGEPIRVKAKVGHPDALAGRGWS